MQYLYSPGGGGDWANSGSKMDCPVVAYAMKSKRVIGLRLTATNIGGGKDGDTSEQKQRQSREMMSLGDY